MRSLVRLILAHVLASFALQAFLLAWMVINKEHIGLVRAAFGMALSPILVLVVLLGLSVKMRLVGRIVYWLLYLAMLTGTYLLLRWRARHKALPELRTSNGLCASCGNDLRRTPGKCPKCGPEQ